MERQPQLAVSIALRHADDGSFLLVKRGRAPSKGMWAFAGGRVEFGETLFDAAKRELKEETGLVSDDLTMFEQVEVIRPSDTEEGPSHHYLLCVHTGTARGGPVAADDAADAKWVSLAGFDDLDVTKSTRQIAERLFNL